MRGQCSKTGDHICTIKCARNLGTQLCATDLTLHVFQSHFVLLNNGYFMAGNTISVTSIPDTLPVLYKCIASFFFDGNRHWVFVPVLLCALYSTVSLKLSFNMACWCHSPKNLNKMFFITYVRHHVLIMCYWNRCSLQDFVAPS